MTRRLLSTHFKKIVVALLASSASALTSALSFDAVTVLSHLGEPLHAEIPVVLTEGERIDSGISVRPALPQAYQDAHIPFQDQLLTIHYHLEKKSDQQYMLIATSDQPIDTPMLVALVELTSQGSRVFKELVFPIESNHAGNDRDHKQLRVDFRFEGALNILPTSGVSSGAAVNEQNQLQHIRMPDRMVIPHDIAQNPHFLQEYLETSSLNVAVSVPPSPPSVHSSEQMGGSSVNLSVPSTDQDHRSFDQMSVPQYAAMPTQVPASALEQLHRVRAGETLISVAQLYLYPHIDVHVMAESIAERNALSPQQNALQPGMVLVIPSFMAVQAHQNTAHTTSSSVHPMVRPRVTHAAHHVATKKSHLTSHRRIVHHHHKNHHMNAVVHVDKKEERPHRNMVKVSKALLSTQTDEEDVVAQRRAMASVDEMQKKIDAEIKAIEQHKQKDTLQNAANPISPAVSPVITEQSGVSLPKSASMKHTTLSEREELSPFEQMMRDYGGMIPYVGGGVVVVLILLILIVVKRKQTRTIDTEDGSKDSLWKRLFSKKKMNDLTPMDSSHLSGPSLVEKNISVADARQASADHSVVFDMESSDEVRTAGEDLSRTVSGTGSSESHAVHAKPDRMSPEPHKTKISDTKKEASPSGDLDPISEAGVYMAYGRLGQAEELLSDALRKNPDHQDIRLKLLDVFAQQKNVVAFAQEAAIYYESCRGQGEAWQAVAELGRGLDPDNVLYSDSAPSSSHHEEALEPLDLSVDLEEVSDHKDMSQSSSHSVEKKPTSASMTHNHTDDDGSEFIVSLDDQPTKKS